MDPTKKFKSRLYVRVKDKIIDITGKVIKNTYYDLKEDEIYLGCDNSRMIFGTGLETLVDSYIIVIENNYEVCDWQALQRYKEDDCFYTAIYGAVWITLPNGAPRLEPVTKLNNEGEFELL